MNTLLIWSRRLKRFACPKIWQITALFIFLIVPFSPIPCFSATVDLTWDPNSDASYYIVYWGETSGTYTFNSQHINTPSTSYTATVEDGKTFYFAVKAFNDCGNSSDFSDEVVYSPLNQELPSINLAPVASAGSDQAVTEGDTVTLNASGSSDSDDGIASYQWTQTDGTTVTFADPKSAITTFTAPATGSEGEALSFRITVTDQGGLSSTDTCQVTVSPTPPPVTDANTVTISWDSNSDASYYIVYWGETSGSYTFNSQKIIAPATSFEATVEAGTTYYFSVKAFNDCGNSSDFSDEVVYASTDNVPLPTNDPPVANAGADQAVPEKTLVNLDASASSDAEGSIASYQWTQIGGTPVTLSSPGSASSSFTAPETGLDGETLTFRITVTDQGGLSATDECLVAVSNVNHSPVASAGADQTVPEGTSVSLSAMDSSDPDGDAISYQWTQSGGAVVTLSNASSASPTFSAPETGAEGATLTFRVTVTDSGNLSSYDDCRINVTNINEAPVANAGTDLVTDEGSAVTLNAGSSSDPDDGIATYQWTQTAGTTVTLSNPASIYPTFTAPETGVEGETLTFQLTVIDFGSLSSSDECLVTVSNVNKSPVANAGADLSVDEGLTVTLDATASSDPDDGIASYQWTQLTGTQVALSNPGTASPSFTAPDTGPEGEALTFSLTVTDKSGLSSSDECRVTILFVNQPPYADAGSDQEVDEGKDVILSAAKSSDPDDGIASYLWFQTQGPTVTLSSNSAISPTFTAPEASTEGLTLTFQLVVEDKQGVMAADTCDVLVKDSAIVEIPPEPVSPEYATTLLSEFPTIELLDADFQHKAWLKVGWAEYTSLNGEARVATGDIDNDGNDEVIIGLAQVPDNPAIPGGFFQVLDHDYSHLAWGYVNWPEYNAINGETWPACGDLDGDGVDEIVIGLGAGGEGTYEVFEYEQGRILHREWGKGSWPEYNAVSGEIRPVLGDIDMDGKDEIMVGLGPVADVAEMPGGFFEFIDSDFSHMFWGQIDWPDYNALNGETWPAFGSLAGTSAKNLIVGLGEGGNGRSMIFDMAPEGPSPYTWLQVDWQDYNDISGQTRPALADVDRDGMDEVLTGLGPVKKSRSIPNGLFQVNDDDSSLFSWGQISWTEYNLKNGESRLAFGMSNNEITIFVSLGERQEKVTGATRSSRK